MASAGLIDEYLISLGQRMRGRVDAHDLIDEIADHLLTAAERLEARGIDRQDAEARALARLGEPRLVASLLTSTPSKGTIVSLFFSRRLGIFAAAAAIAWAFASFAAYFGFTSLSGSWDTTRYLVSAVLVGIACALTAAVLLGVNIRARGTVDSATVAITTLALVSAIAATLLAWVVALWMPLLAAAVTWTCVRARRAHAGSPAFAVTLALVSPLLGIAAIGVSVYGILTGTGMEGAIWGSVAAFGALLLAGFADIAARVAQSLRSPHALAE